MSLCHRGSCRRCDRPLVKVQALDAGDADAVTKALGDRLAHAQGKLALYDRLRDRLLAGRSEAEYVRTSERIGPYLTLMGGRMFEQQSMRWITAVLEILAVRSGRGQAVTAHPGGGRT